MFNNSVVSGEPARRKRPAYRAAPREELSVRLHDATDTGTPFCTARGPRVTQHIGRGHRIKQQLVGIWERTAPPNDPSLDRLTQRWRATTTRWQECHDGRNVYSDEFKRAAVERVIVQRHTRKSVAARLEVNYHILLE